MTVYILTSDKTNYLIKGMQYCINKYWPDAPLIKILGYDNLNFNLPAGFEFISLGKDMGANNVTSDLIKFFSTISESNFIFTVDDFFPMRPVSSSMLDILSNYMDSNDVSRIALDGHVKSKPYTVYEEFNSFTVVELSQLADYRKSAVWSIWNKDYFLKYLPKCSNLWEWELDTESKFDGHIILGTIKKHTIQASHLIKRGNIKSDWFKDSESNDVMHQEDIDILKKILGARFE